MILQFQVIYPMKASRRYTDTARSHLTAGISDAKCYVGPHSVHTFDGSLYNYTLDHCDHVLVTDSWMKFHLAVLSRQLDDRKVVTAISIRTRSPRIGDFERRQTCFEWTFLSSRWRPINCRNPFVRRWNQIEIESGERDHQDPRQSRDSGCTSSPAREGDRTLWRL